MTDGQKLDQNNKSYNGLSEKYDIWLTVTSTHISK